MSEAVKKYFIRQWMSHEEVMENLHLFRQSHPALPDVITIPPTEDPYAQLIEWSYFWDELSN